MPLCNSQGVGLGQFNLRTAGSATSFQKLRVSIPSLGPGRDNVSTFGIVKVSFVVKAEHWSLEGLQFDMASGTVNVPFTFGATANF